MPVLVSAGDYRPASQSYSEWRFVNFIKDQDRSALVPKCPAVSVLVAGLGRIYCSSLIFKSLRTSNFIVTVIGTFNAGATDFALPLIGMTIACRKQCAGRKNRQPESGSGGEVANVYVAAIGPRRDGVQPSRLQPVATPTQPGMGSNGTIMSLTPKWQSSPSSCQW